MCLEYKKKYILNQNIRDFRMLQISCNPNNPFYHFNYGNFKTLLYNKSISKLTNNIALFNNKYFISNWIKIVMYSNKKLNKWKKLIEPKFNDIKIKVNAKVKKPLYKYVKPITIHETRRRRRIIRK